MPLKILILDCTLKPYNGASIDVAPTGGIPLVTTRLAECLAHKHEVWIRNHTNENITFRNVHWENVGAKTKAPKPDIILASNDVNLFAMYDEWIKSGSKPILWARNLITWKRIFKKRRLRNLIKYRPPVVFLSRYHLNSCSSLIPLGKKYIIPHGVDDEFFNYPLGVERKPQVLFLSKAFRGFTEVANMWINYIYPHFACKIPKVVLRAYIGREELNNMAYTDEFLRSHHIEVLDRAPQSVLRAEMACSAALIYPGHSDETFCNVAAESSVLGLPILTLGIGALAERSQNGMGIMAQNYSELAAHMVELLNNPQKIQFASQQVLEYRDQYRWHDRIKDWNRLFENLLT